MAERPDAYVRKNPGDVIQSNEWNELQVKAREEIRAHRHTGSEDGSLIPRAGIETGAIDGKLIDPVAEVSVKTLTTSGNLTVKGELAVNGKALLGDITDLLATVKGLQDDKLDRRGDTVSGTLRVQRNLLVDGRVGVGTSDACTKLEVIGGALISNGSGFAVQANYMASGSLTIGGTSTGYGGGRGWGSSTAGLLLETKGTTEIAVHDAGTRLTSLLYYNDNRITIGRDMGWNVTPLIVAGNVGIGTTTPTQKLVVEADHNSGKDADTGLSYGGQLAIRSNTPQVDFINTASRQLDWAIMVNDGSMHFISEPWLSNLVLAANGNVGIGTTTPSRKLQIGPDVDGLGFELAQHASPNVGVIRFGDNTGWKLHFGRSRELPNGELNSGLSGVLMTIRDNGNVGIGTDNPLQQLTITGGLGFANQNAGDKKLYSPKDGLLEWMTHDAAGDHGFAVSHQGEARVYLNTNGNSYLNGGNVGIGTTTPSQKLLVQGSHNAGKDPDSGLSNGGQLAIKGNAPQIDFIDTDHNDWAIHVNGGRMYFIRQPWNYSDLVLDGNGNVGIGTHTPSQKLEVVGNLNVTGSIIRSVSMATALGPEDQTDNGQIPSRVLSFTKLHAETAIRIIYCDNFRVNGNNVAARWEIRIDGAPPPGGAIFQDKYGSFGNFHEPATMMGYAKGIAPGTHTIGVWVGPAPNYPVCDAYTGWGSSRWTLEAQEVWV